MNAQIAVKFSNPNKEIVVSISHYLHFRQGELVRKKPRKPPVIMLR